MSGTQANHLKDNDDPAQDQDKPKRLVRRSHMVVGLLLALLVALAVVLITIIPMLIPAGGGGTQDGLPSEVTLTLWLVIGVTVLMIVIMAVALLSSFVIGKRGTPTALGLPEGSVSAIIALLLLLIFAISSVYLFSQIRGGEGDGFVSRGLTAAGIGSLPQDRILEATVENPAVTDEALRTYSVRLAAAHADSVDFAKTSAQTIGTLLAAVAGFYFGQRATQSGAHIVEGSGRNRPTQTGDGGAGSAGAVAAPAATVVAARKKRNDGESPQRSLGN